MRIRLTLWQRLLLIATAAIIALVLLSQVEEDGWSDSPWLLAILVIAALLLVAASPQSSANKRPAISLDALDKNKLDEGSDVVRERFTRAYQSWSDYLKGALIDRSPKMPKIIKDKLDPHADLVGLKAAFATYLLVIARRSVGAFKGKDAMALRAIAGGLLSNGIHEDGVEVDPNFNQDIALEVALRELAKVEGIVMKVMEAFRKDETFPMEPLWQEIEQELPLGLKTPADREAFYGMKLREEIGRLLI